jgi:hypothetical protein
LVFLALLLWGNTFVIAGPEAGPDGQLFKIGVLGIAAYLAGALVQSIGLPPLLGMLITGIVLKNTRSVEIKGPYLVLAADVRFVHCSRVALRVLEVFDALLLSLCYAFFLSHFFSPNFLSLFLSFCFTLL